MVPIILKDKSYLNQVNYPVIKHVVGENNLILDVGCGAGVHAKYFNDLGNVVDGITLSEQEKIISQRFMRNIYIYNLENGLPTNIESKYNYVLCSHVIEHLAYPEKLLSDIGTKLRDNGVLVVAVPNALHYSSRWKFLKGNFPEEESGIWDYTHLRWYTLIKMRNLLKRSNYTILFEDFDIPLPFNRFFKYFPTWIKNIIKKVLRNISPGLFASQLIYVAQKI